MSKKSILYVTPAFPIGGAEKFLVLLANSLAAETSKQTVVSLSSDNKLQHEFDAGISFLALPRKSKFDMAPAKAIRKLIATEKPDIIFCLNFFAFCFIRLASIGVKHSAKIIISYHSTVHVTKKEHLLHKLFTALLAKKDTIITVCKNQAVYTENKYNISNSFFKTIYNGIDTVKWDLPSATDVTAKEIRKKYALPENATVIIMTAAFRPEKNHAGAVKALQILHKQYSLPAYLLFVGEGVLYEQTKQMVAELNLQQYVIFTGAQKDVRPFYWASNVFSLCSTSVETFSIAALEAMACGLPAVLTNIGGANEMIEEGLNGFISETNEADIALKWSLVLTQSFSAVNIHDYINTHFGATKMVEEYKQTLALV